MCHLPFVCVVRWPLCDAIPHKWRKRSWESCQLHCCTALIVLDKCPGVRSIGGGEVYRWIISKAVLQVVSPDVQQTVWGVHLCVGQANGCEAGVHLMRQLHNDKDVEGTLLVDAGNVFNNLNHHVALHNIQAICPSLATILMNTYRMDSSSSIDGETIHLLLWRTTQGDLLPMYMYALATLPLIESLPNQVHQIWLLTTLGHTNRFQGVVGFFAWEGT